MIRTVQSFLHFWGLESCVRSKSYNTGSDPLWPTLSVLSHDFVNASIEDVAVTSLGKLCVCLCVCFFSSYSLHYIFQKMQKQNELQTSANCLEGSQNITYSLQI